MLGIYIFEYRSSFSYTRSSEAFTGSRLLVLRVLRYRDVSEEGFGLVGRFGGQGNRGFGLVWS